MAHSDLGRYEKGEPISSRGLALLSDTVLDIPPRARTLLLIAGVIGVGFAFMESLVGNRPETIPVDKLIHFIGYTLVAGAFALALKPKLLIPTLLVLAGIGIAIELVQPFTGRDREVSDAITNAIAIVVGATIGLIARLIYGYVRTQWETHRMRKNLFRIPAGEIILHEGQPLDEFYLIRRGEVELYREKDGMTIPMGTAGKGDMLGLLAEVDEQGVVATSRARTETWLYRMDLETLQENAGGQDSPVALVIRALTADLRKATERIVALESRQKSAGSL